MQRRTLICSAMCCIAGMGWSGLSRGEGSEADGPKVGDRLADADHGSPAAALTPDDVTLGAAAGRLVYPMDPASRVLRDGSRLNKILLVRLPLESLSADHPGRGSGGVLAFSAICTHQGCVVGAYLPTEHNLMCPCHFSKFDVIDGGHVAGGPAPRSLPTLTLTLESKELVLASGFSAVPGVKRSS